MATVEQIKKASKDGSWPGILSDQITDERLKFGAILRIADATELMATNFIALQNDRDLYKRWYYEEKQKNIKNDKYISILRGLITRYKNKLTKIKQENNGH